MANAPEELAEIESTTDWPALIEMALADPPKPDPLLLKVNRWAAVFSVVYDGQPFEPDFPEPVRVFFRRLAAADFPPELLEWIEKFQVRHDRKPGTSDIPRRLRHLIPSDKPNGRPRADTRRWLAARRAWQAAIFSGSYEMRRDLIANVGEYMTSTFGFTPDDVRGERPHLLALEKMTEETGLSVSRLQDLMGHRKRS